MSSDFRVDLQFVALGGKIFLPEVRIEVASAVGPVDTLLAVGERPLIEIGGKNVEVPPLEPACRFFQQDHAEGVRLFSGRAACTPDAKILHRNLRPRLKNMRYDDVANCVQLGKVSKEAGFADGDLI